MPRLVTKYKYPKPKKERVYPPRRYYVEYHAEYIFHTGRSFSTWTGHYRTKVGAYIAMYVNIRHLSLGGDAKLYENDSWKNGQRNERKL